MDKLNNLLMAQPNTRFIDLDGGYVLQPLFNPWFERKHLDRLWPAQEVAQELLDMAYEGSEEQRADEEYFRSGTRYPGQ